jgi:hypothetical protein
MNLQTVLRQAWGLYNTLQWILVTSITNVIFALDCKKRKEKWMTFTLVNQIV